MSLTDSTYGTVSNYINEFEMVEDINFDVLYDLINTEIGRNAITYSWTRRHIRDKIMSFAEQKPTEDCITWVIRQINGSFNRRNPASDGRINDVIRDFWEEGDLSFINNNKIEIKEGAINVNLHIPGFINIIEIQSEFYDICEKYALKAEVEKDFSDTTLHKLIFNIKGDMNGLVQIKSLLERQIKSGAKVIKVKKGDKEETNDSN